jgi:hypothetical protein
VLGDQASETISDTRPRPKVFGPGILSVDDHTEGADHIAGDVDGGAKSIAVAATCFAMYRSAAA